MEHDLSQISYVVLDAASCRWAIDCLESIRRYSPGSEIVLVGNGVQSQAIGLADKYIYQQNNIGYSNGNNLGASWSTKSFLCFMNDDARWVDAQSPQMMLKALSEEDIIVGPYSNGAKVPQWVPNYENCPKEDELVPMVMGMCLMVRRSTFDKIGPWDPEFVNYSDDDFCLRGCRAGVPTKVVGGAWVNHMLHASFKALGKSVVEDGNAMRVKFRRKYGLK